MSSLTEKYRPCEINDLLGQPNALLIYELLDTYVAPSYLFFGPPGTGKTSAAKLLISKIENKQVQYEKFSDILEINCGLNGNVDDIKDVIVNKCQMPPRILTRRYVILDECQMLTTHAQNALLNIMEIPPPYLTFILCTTEYRKLIQALKSRCLQVKFLPGKKEEIILNLKNICQSENIVYDDAGLEIIYNLSGGSFRESLILLSQYSSIGATNENISMYSGSLNKKEVESLLYLCFSKNGPELIQKLSLINKSNIKVEEVLKIALEICTELIANKICQTKSNSVLQECTQNISLIKICDVINDSIKSLSPATPENLHLQITMFKLLALSK